MKKNMEKKMEILIFILIVLIGGLASSCAFLGPTAGSSEPTTSTPAAPATVSIPAAPANEQGYTNLPFAKIINPAFVDDVANKWIRGKVAFVEIVNTVIDLPSEYQTGYVRLMICDPNNTPVNCTTNAVIPKSKSDLFFTLHSTETKAGIMYPVAEIHAYLVPMIEGSAISGRAENQILIVINKATHHD